MSNAQASFTRIRTACCLLLFASSLGLGVASAAERQRDQLAAVARARPDVTQGEQIFRSCAACHGRDAEGSSDGLAPRLAGQRRVVLARQLVAYRFAKRWDIRMEQITSGHLLPDAQAIADVAGFLALLAPSPPRDGIGDGSLAEQGERLYSSRCAKCHGAEAQGTDLDAVPMLRGQHYAYLLRQLHDAVESRRPGFSAAHIRLLEPLDRDDLVGLADYLSRLPPVPSGNPALQQIPFHQ